MITLKTLPQATAQEVFDQVKNHLLTQNKKSAKITDKGELLCLYRGTNNKTCAAGCLIADDEYKPEMENKTWLNLIGNFNITLRHNDLITALQYVHDNCDPDEWPGALKRVATNYNLKY